MSCSYSAGSVGSASSSSDGQQLGARPKIARQHVQQQTKPVSRSSAGQQRTTADSKQNKEWNSNWNSILSAQVSLMRNFFVYPFRFTHSLLLRALLLFVPPNLLHLIPSSKSTHQKKRVGSFHPVCKKDSKSLDESSRREISIPKSYIPFCVVSPRDYRSKRNMLIKLDTFPKPLRGRQIKCNEMIKRRRKRQKKKTEGG